MQYHFYGLNKILESATKSAFLSFGIFMMFSNALLAETQREREREAFRA